MRSSFLESKINNKLPDILKGFLLLQQPQRPCYIYLYFYKRKMKKKNGSGGEGSAQGLKVPSKKQHLSFVTISSPHLLREPCLQLCSLWEDKGQQIYGSLSWVSEAQLSTRKAPPLDMFSHFLSSIFLSLPGPPLFLELDDSPLLLMKMPL